MKQNIPGPCRKKEGNGEAKCSRKRSEVKKTENGETEQG